MYNIYVQTCKCIKNAGHCILDNLNNSKMKVRNKIKTARKMKRHVVTFPISFAYKISYSQRSLTRKQHTFCNESAVQNCSFSDYLSTDLKTQSWKKLKRNQQNWEKKSIIVEHKNISTLSQKMLKVLVWHIQVKTRLKKHYQIFNSFSICNEITVQNWVNKEDNTNVKIRAWMLAGLRHNAF